MKTRRLVPLLSLLIAGACSADPTAVPSASEWTLQSVNDLPPAGFLLVQGPTDTTRISSGSITITGSTFVQVFVYEVTEQGRTSTVTTTDSGTVAQTGDTVLFGGADDGASGTIAGNTLYLVEAPLALTYVRQ